MSLEKTSLNLSPNSVENIERIDIDKIEFLTKKQDKNTGLTSVFSRSTAPVDYCRSYLADIKSID